MNKLVRTFFLFFFFLVISQDPNAMATPIDLTGFVPSESPFVRASSNRINFIEDGSNTASSEWIYGNASYTLASNATTMTFDYGITLGDGDKDFLAFEINYNEEFSTFILAGPGTETGTATIDLTPYQGLTVQMDWILYWGFDEAAGATAFVENIDIATSETEPVPESSTILLLGLGLLSTACVGRKNRSLNT